MKVPFKIFFEDDEIIVLDKPSGISVHPTSTSYKEKTIVDFVSSKIKNKNQFEKLRPGIVHRLDKDTSGLLIVAKNKESYNNLVKQIKNRAIEKKYLVLVWGRLSPEVGSVEIPLKRGPSYLKVAPRSFGKYARTEYKVTEYLGDFSLLCAKIITGRTHQIRVHLSSIGFPVVGDKLYSSKKEQKMAKELGLGRQFLHALKIGFEHPKTGKWLEFESEIPEDLKIFLGKLRG